MKQPTSDEKRWMSSWKRGNWHVQPKAMALMLKVRRGNAG